MEGLRNKLNNTYLGGSNSLTKQNNIPMDGLQSKLDQTYLDGSPGRYNTLITNKETAPRKYDALNQYTKTPEGAIRGQGNLLTLFEKAQSDGLLNNPASPYTSKIGSEVITSNTSTPYTSEKTYSDQFRAQGDETLLNRTIDKYL